MNQPYPTYLGGPTPDFTAIEQPAHLGPREHASTEFVDPSPIAVPQASQQPSFREVAADVANRTGNILSGLGLAGLGWLGLQTILHAGKAETLKQVDGMIKSDDQTWDSYVHLLNEHTAAVNENIHLLHYPFLIGMLGVASFVVSTLLCPDESKLPTRTSTPKP